MENTGGNVTYTMPFEPPEFIPLFIPVTGMERSYGNFQPLSDMMRKDVIYNCFEKLWILTSEFYISYSLISRFCYVE